MYLFMTLALLLALPATVLVRFLMTAHREKGHKNADAIALPKRRTRTDTPSAWTAGDPLEELEALDEDVMRVEPSVVGAHIVHPFSLSDLDELRHALEKTCRVYQIDPADVEVRFSAHPKIGKQVLILHLTQDGHGNEPFMRIDHDSGHFFGASLSGQLDDLLPTENVASVWTCASDGTAWRIDEGFMYVAESAEADVGDGLFEKLGEHLDTDNDFIFLDKLKAPDTDGVKLNLPFSETLKSRIRALATP